MLYPWPRRSNPPLHQSATPEVTTEGGAGGVTSTRIGKNGGRASRQAGCECGWLALPTFVLFLSTTTQQEQRREHVFLPRLFGFVGGRRRVDGVSRQDLGTLLSWAQRQNERIVLFPNSDIVVGLGGQARLPLLYDE